MCLTRAQKSCTFATPLGRKKADDLTGGAFEAPLKIQSCKCGTDDSRGLNEG